MKTKNNVQKAILRTGAVVVSFVLISFTVSAQDFWKRLITNSSFNEIAVAMIETESELPEKTETSTRAIDFNAVHEPKLELENWMISDSYFYFDLFALENESENSLQVEDWMLNEENFNFSQEPEEALEVEDWMVSGNHWNS